MAGLEEENEQLREQIEELKENLKHRNCLDCSNHSSNLRMRNLELEAQIEKMKCCYNCKHSRTDYEHCNTNKHEKWELAE